MCVYSRCRHHVLLAMKYGSSVILKRNCGKWANRELKNHIYYASMWVCKCVSIRVTKTVPLWPQSKMRHNTPILTKSIYARKYVYFVIGCTHVKANSVSRWIRWRHLLAVKYNNKEKIVKLRRFLRKKICLIMNMFIQT